MELQHEMYEKALYLVKNAGDHKGIYSTFNKDRLHISYSSYHPILTVFYDLNQVLQFYEDEITVFVDGDWIHKINEEYRKVHIKCQRERANI